MRVPHIIIIYDSVYNSVFESQVLLPALAHQDREIIVVSFERAIPSKQDQQQLQKKYPTVQWVFFKRLPFIIPFLLYWDIYRIKRLLKQYRNFYLQARGPLVAFVVQKVVNYAGCRSMLIQIRGLLAEEYLYGIPKKSMLHAFRYRMFKRLEKKAYSVVDERITYEVVSPALQEYVVTNFNTPQHLITLAHGDIPPLFARELCNQWRTEMRQLLAIKPEQRVYCYNGSAKAWQCPELVIQFFCKRYGEDSRSFLLVLTQDVAVFGKLLGKIATLKGSFHVIKVEPQEIYRYLAASDVGLLFRESHIINWVSRPTKMLEYQAVGLAIEHNNTIAWLVEVNATKKAARQCHSQKD